MRVDATYTFAMINRNCFFSFWWVRLLVVLTLFATGLLAFFRKWKPTLLDIPVNDQPDPSDVPPSKQLGLTRGRNKILAKLREIALGLFRFAANSMCLSQFRILAEQLYGTLRPSVRIGAARPAVDDRFDEEFYDAIVVRRPYLYGLLLCEDAPIRLYSREIGDRLAYVL